MAAVVPPNDALDASSSGGLTIGAPGNRQRRPERHPKQTRFRRIKRQREKRDQVSGGGGGRVGGEILSSCQGRRNSSSGGRAGPGDQRDWICAICCHGFLLKEFFLFSFFSTPQDEVGGEEKPVYKKVAVVEEFFDIIYREHVEFMNHGGRPTANGKHAGQKRTYRAVSSPSRVILLSAILSITARCLGRRRRRLFLKLKMGRKSPGRIWPCHRRHGGGSLNGQGPLPAGRLSRASPRILRERSLAAVMKGSSSPFMRMNPLGRPIDMPKSVAAAAAAFVRAERSSGNRQSVLHFDFSFSAAP